MKLASLFFFVLLVHAHQVCGFHESLNQPLCDFREGDFGLLGYALFCAIALIGVVYTFALRRFGKPDEAANTVGGGLLLLIVAATPSGWPLHHASAFILLASIYAHYALLLNQSRSLLLTHLSVPIVLAVGTGFQSYGLWQKGLICYFVVVAVVHHHVAKSRRRAHATETPNTTFKDPKAYRIEPSQAGARLTGEKNFIKA